MISDQTIEELRGKAMVAMTEIMRANYASETLLADFKIRGSRALSGFNWSGGPVTVSEWMLLLGQLYAYEVALGQAVPGLLRDIP